MVQIAKEHVRDAFVRAAAATFAELGFAATSMAAVAERAGSSVGNLYKYFPGKQQLFDAAVPPELAVELQRRAAARMRAFGSVKDVRELDADAPYHALAGDLLDYCLEHRAAVVVVLSRAEGTAYSSFTSDLVNRLVDWALEYARGPYPRLTLTPELRFALRHAYQTVVAGTAQALLQFSDDASARSAIHLLTVQHQAGLKRLFETQGDGDARPRTTKSPISDGPAVPSARNAGAGGAGSSLARPGARKVDRASRTRRRR